MDAVARLGACAVDAVGRSPKEGWQDVLILACDDVEEVYDELLAALEGLLDATENNVLHVDAMNARVKAREAAREAIAKAKGGE